MNKINVLMSLNDLANTCGYFFNAELTPLDPNDETFYPGKQPSPNNGYNCRHSQQEEVHDGIGCCYGWSCPLENAFEADEEDCDKFGYEYEKGAYMLVEIEESEFDPHTMTKEIKGRENK